MIANAKAADGTQAFAESAHHKIPRYWWVIDEFPMTVTGQIQKFKLRDRAAAHWGLTQGDAATAEPE